MMYNVKVFFNGCQVPLLNAAVHGMTEVDKIIAAYPSDAGYEVDFHPDVYAYMRNRDKLS